MVFHSTKFYLSRIINLKILSTNFIFLKIEPGVDQKAENRRKAEDFREVTRIEWKYSDPTIIRWWSVLDYGHSFHVLIHFNRLFFQLLRWKFINKFHLPRQTHFYLHSNNIKYFHLSDKNCLKQKAEPVSSDFGSIDRNDLLSRILGTWARLLY